MTSHNVLTRWAVTPDRQAHTIGGVLSQAIPDDWAAGGRLRPLLTRRRVVDYCHVSAALCPGSLRLPA